MSKLRIIINGIIKDNPTFVLVLGMCPTIGTTTSAINGMGMGLATTFVLILSNVFISLFAKMIPDKVRIPAYIVIIASFVTVLQLLMQAYVPDLYAALGLFIPLIVVNCIILGRAEAFANKNTPGDSALDGIGIGLGFTLALTFIGLVRELLGSLSLFGMKLGGGDGMLAFVLAPGGFLVLGYLMVIFNIVLSQFLGICPFLGVSNKVSTATGMSAAVVFVITLSTLVTYLLHYYVLVPLGIEFMMTIVFILVIAALVQMVEIILKKISPSRLPPTVPCSVWPSTW